MKLSEFDYHLPPELIAQEPATERDRSRMMVLDKNKGAFSHRHFFNFPDLLKKGDVLDLNDSKVIPARLYGQKETGAAIEVKLRISLEAERPVLLLTMTCQYPVLLYPREYSGSV